MSYKMDKKMTDSKGSVTSVRSSADSGERAQKSERGRSRTGEISVQRKNQFLRITSLAVMILTVFLMIAMILAAAGVHDAKIAAQQKDDAEDFAVALVRSLQSKGLQRVQSQFWDGYRYLDEEGEASRFDGIPFTILDDFKQAGPADKTFSILKKNEKKSLSSIPGTGKVQRYAILDASHNDKKYDVQIEYDPSGYGQESRSDAHAYNKNSFPSAGSLTSDTTAVINPEGAYVSFASDSSGSFKYDDVAQQFKSETRTMEISAMDKMYARRATFYEQAAALINSNMASTEVHNWQQIKGSAFYTTDDKNERIPELKKSTTRNTIIYASGVNGAVSVKSCVQFCLTDESFVGDPKAVIDALPGIFTNATVTVLAEDGTETEEPVPETRVTALKKLLEDQVRNLYKQSTTREALTEQFMVYESDHAASTLENIYLMYYPLRNSEWKRDTISLDFSAIRKQYSKENRLNLYVVPQLGLLIDKKTSYDTIQAADYIAPKLAGGQITFGGDTDLVSIEGLGTLYDIPRVRVHYIKGFMKNLAAADMKDSLTEKTDPNDIIYQLNVKVYKASNGCFRDGELITESSAVSS